MSRSEKGYKHWNMRLGLLLHKHGFKSRYRGKTRYYLPNNTYIIFKKDKVIIERRFEVSSKKLYHYLCRCRYRDCVIKNLEKILCWKDFPGKDKLGIS